LSGSCGLQAGEIDRVATRSIPGFAAEFHADWWPDSRLEVEFLQRLDEVGDSAARILGRKLGRTLKFVPHHLAHAASAYYPSGFDPAAIHVINGIGEAACSTITRGDGTRIETSETFSYPHSLGCLWEQASIHLGFSPYDASKVMGLAPYGDPDIFSRQFASIIRVGQDGYAVDPGALSFPAVDPKGPGAKGLEFTTPEQLGALATFLCSNAAAQLNGVALPVDGGWLAR
jgi:carbamoyltransferase